MASELGNQLLARVQTEMARNIATIKRQLIEWLERPESGGVDALRESMAEISGGLSLMEQEEAVAWPRLLLPVWKVWTRASTNTA